MCVYLFWSAAMLHDCSNSGRSRRAPSAKKLSLLPASWKQVISFLKIVYWTMQINSLNSPVIQNIKKGLVFFEECCHCHEETGIYKIRVCTESGILAKERKSACISFRDLGIRGACLVPLSHQGHRCSREYREEHHDGLLINAKGDVVWRFTTTAFKMAYSIWP